MLMQVRPISDFDKTAYLVSLMKILDQFVVQLSQVKNLYDDVGYVFPLSCYNNFRDALFHYLKITKLDEESKILCEGYALQEHLHRSIKDSIINFLQQLVICIENLVHLNKISQEQEEYSRKCLKEYGCSDCKEILKILEKLDDIGVEKELVTIIIKYMYITKIKSPETDRALREQMHKIKNYILSIRNESLLIRQPYKSQAKIDDFFVLYNEIKETLEKYNLYNYVFLNFE